LFGGAFDPPHNAHLALAQAALSQLQLDVLYVVPTGDAWHKTRVLSPGHHRMAMCQLLFANLAQVQVSDIELNRPGPSYTVDTLSILRQQHVGAKFFLVVGADQAASFNQWQQSQQILAWAQLVVAKRSWPDEKPQPFFEWHNQQPIALNLPLMPISATASRQRTRDGDDLSGLLPAAVIHYIQTNHLYLDNHDRSL
jgi:nicotinate-nucleotide adenylyltransferase